MKKFIQIKDTKDVDCTIFIEHIAIIKNIENIYGYGEGNTKICFINKELFLNTNLTYKEVIDLINN